MPTKTATKKTATAVKTPRMPNPARATECRAQDPAHCPYHVAEGRALSAFERGDLDAAFKALMERDRNKRVLKQEQERFERELLDEAVRKAGDTSLEHATFETKRAHLEGLVDAQKLPLTSKLKAKLRRKEAIDAVATGVPQETVYDVLKRMPPASARDADKIAAIREVIALWQDRKSLQGPERNLLHPESAATGTERAMAQLLVDEGAVVSDTESSYGWQDYTYSYSKKAEAIRNSEAVLDVTEDDWYEFLDTYNGSEHKHGIAGTVLLGDGTVRKLRVEAELSQMMNWVAKRF